MSNAAESTHAVEAELAFSRIEDVSVEAGRRGGLRARTMSAEAMADPRSYDRRRCRIVDCSTGDFQPDLQVHGFGHVDLSRLHALQGALARVRGAGRLDETSAAQIRGHLLGRSLPLSGGARLRVLYLAREGFFMRRAGPNGLRMGDGSRMGMNGHDAAMAVHADQDVDGTPLRQILRGAAPWLFRHESPDRSNLRSRLLLTNLWIPLDQVTRPLALMDRRTLDRRAHQLRHGLPTDAFFRRREATRVNDIWTFLHDERQRWYFTSEMDARTGYAFETLGTPHGSFIVPGEEAAEALYLQLTAATAAVRSGDTSAVARALAVKERPGGAWRAPATAPLRRAIAAMESVLAEGRADVRALREEAGASWCARATAAAERVVRTSIEMRAVVLLTSATSARS